jgi:hypothetical protein
MIFMSGGKFMKRKVQSGEVVEVTLFPVGSATKPRKGRKKGSTTSRKQDANMRLAVRKLAQSIHCNFRQGDIFLTLKYSQERIDKLIEEIKADGQDVTPDTIRLYAIHERDCFLRRIKRNMLARGQELRYIASTSDIDGSTGELVKVHHHLIIPKEAFDFVFRHWAKDWTNYTPLDNRKDHTALAEYIIKQCRRQPDKKKYTVSQNLKKPVVISEEIITVKEELKVPRGANVTHRDPFDFTAPTQYVRYIEPPKNKKRGGKRE